MVQLVADAAATRVQCAQDAAGQQIRDVASCGVRRTRNDRRPFAAGEFALEAIKQPINPLHLSLVERRRTRYTEALPEPRLSQNSVQRVLCLIDGAVQSLKNPDEPIGDIEGLLLRSF